MQRWCGQQAPPTHEPDAAPPSQLDSKRCFVWLQNDKLATCSTDGMVNVLLVAPVATSGATPGHLAVQHMFKLRGHTADVNCVAASPCGRLLCSVSDDKSARLWNVQSVRLFSFADCHPAVPLCQHPCLRVFLTWPVFTWHCHLSCDTVVRAVCNRKLRLYVMFEPSLCLRHAHCAGPSC